MPELPRRQKSAPAPTVGWLRLATIVAPRARGCGTFVASHGALVREPDSFVEFPSEKASAANIDRGDYGPSIAPIGPEDFGAESIRSGCSRDPLLAFAPEQAARDGATKKRWSPPSAVSRPARFVSHLDVTLAAVCRWCGVRVLRTFAACTRARATAFGTWLRFVQWIGARRSTRARVDHMTAYVRATAGLVLRQASSLIRRGYEAIANWNTNASTVRSCDPSPSLTFVLGVVVGALLAGYGRPIPEQSATPLVSARPTDVTRPEIRVSASPDVRRESTGSSRPDRPPDVHLAAPTGGQSRSGNPVLPVSKPDRRPEQIQPYRGSVVVTSSPSGAAVFINGRHAGTTPVVLRGVPVGSRAVRVSLEGYATWSRAIQVVANRRTEVNAVLSIQRPVLAPAQTAPRRSLVAPVS